MNDHDRLWRGGCKSAPVLHFGFAVLSALALVACGQQAGAAGADAAVIPDADIASGDVAPTDTSAGDALVDSGPSDVVAAEVVADVPLPDIALDVLDVTDVVDVADVPPDSALDAADAIETSTTCEFADAPSAGAPGATCAKDSDCDSGSCATAPEGKRCAPSCASGCCPTGWSCAKSASSAICKPKWTAACVPCVADTDCTALTSGSLCVKHGSTGSYCATPCTDVSDCPSNYSCTYSFGVKDEGNACVSNDACDCNATAIATGAKTNCSISNAVGFCKGQRVCATGGLQICDAFVPAVETCNGIDDDCNGQTDEGMPDQDADGVPDCDDPDLDGDGAKNGVDCAPTDPAVHPGAAEKCNGVDDNCDGQTDEGFADTDGDGLADCIDPDIDGDGVANAADCSPVDGGVFASNVEICDGKDQNCNGQTDEGFPDADKDGVADCVDPDADGDGVANAADCSPTDPAVFPGQKETCDGLDNNCNAQTDEGFGDLDKDGIADCVDLDIDGDGVANVLDCAPENPAIHPLAVEVCNGVDDNCDGATDPGCDDDKDGYCDAALPVDPTSVACPFGGGDCDDTHAMVHPGAQETCDGLDDDCDGVTDPGCDADGDGYCVGKATVSVGCPNGGGDCNDQDKLTHPGGTEVCDNQDQNCDGVTDEGCDADGDGYCIVTSPAGAKFPACKSGGGDCNDQDKLINPGAIDICNGKDDDCDGVSDPGCDLDGDGYCSGAVAAGPGCPSGGGDCNDSNAAIHPGAYEVCDDIDNDCVNGVDDGCDVDGDGWCVLGALVSGTPAVCHNGYGDCNDTKTSVYPGAPELCDSLDNACTGKPDAGCDKDGDGWCDAGRITVGTPWICLWGGGDCDDNNPAIRPNAIEKCDGIDNNCDQKIDVMGSAGCTTYYADADLDGYGDASQAPHCLCAAQAPWVVLVAQDCDDTNSAVHPGATEVCDDIDNNCDKKTDIGCDDDLDGYCDIAMVTVGKPKVCPSGGGDCNDATSSIYPTHPEACDDLDNDCNGLTDTGCDDDADGFCDAKMLVVGTPAACGYGGGDCDDTNSAIRPGVTEVCDDKDNNCISGVDEGCNDDGDLYCDSAMLTVGKPSTCPGGGGDCDDLVGATHPGAIEVCDDLDNNCVAGTDEGCNDDLDQYCDGNMVTVGYPKLCPAGGGDCDDANPLVGALSTGSCVEICDGKDNNLDGVVDENCDKDKDGYCDASRTTLGTPSSCPSGGGDCDDTNWQVNPGAKELCQTPTIDDNCDGALDSDGAVGCNSYFRDIDGDGWGGQAVCYCSPPGAQQTITSVKIDTTQTQYVPVIGSDKTGVHFDNDCPSGYVATGIQGLHTDSPIYMSSFTLQCKKLNSNGTLGALGVAPTSSGGAGTAFGGSCPNGEVLVTEWGDSNGPDAQHLAITRIGGHCSSLARIANQYSGVDDPIPGSPLLFDGGGLATTERYCPVGWVVTGTYGEVSSWHGEFGFKCTPVTLSSSYQVFVSSGGDCNDNNPTVNPATPELCDNLDNNCSGTTDENCDVDNDDYCDATKTVVGKPTICPNGGGDCDDTKAALHPGATEICDALDNDCNGATDSGCDDDLDGYCDATMQTVGKPSTCAQGGGDCVDTDKTIHPGVTEQCDDIDQNCSGTTDEGCDDDADKYCDSAFTTVGKPKSCINGGGDCVDTDKTINPGVVEVCDGIDNNCSGKVDETCDDDGDGWCRIDATFVGNPAICTKGKTDCNDSKATVYPGAPERCDGLDNACSGKTDTGCDDDLDGYCDAAMPFDTVASCAKGAGDCNDTNKLINPGATEICGNGLDDDCSGSKSMTVATNAQTTVANADQSYTSSKWAAFAFTPSESGAMTSLKGLMMNKGGYITNSVVTNFAIFAGGLPGTGTQVGSTASVTVNSAGNTSYDIPLTGVSVIKKGLYYVVFYAGGNGTGYMRTNYDTATIYRSTDSGATWTNTSASSFAYSVIATITGIDGPNCP